ncbi:hypothetical protein Tco_0568056 [Tanacetum coccineum]
MNSATTEIANSDIANSATTEIANSGIVNLGNTKLSIRALRIRQGAITQHYSYHNHLRSSSNTRNQAVIHDGRMDIQSKNVGYAGNGNRNAGRQNRNQETNARNGLVQSSKSTISCKRLDFGTKSHNMGRM